ncbi:hypothetical protein [Bradyrhizobium tropiciagri]|uniref:hypothetical protein n=1 Tax=Bradyrhizobium tropiciagri TaxID=312253 RepID=UPI00067BECCC|nr:hypothetical protein [Bradyrhizobium tropiciagri]
MRTTFVAALLLAYSSTAFAFPVQCTSQFGYSAACCAASYKRKPEGGMDNGQRHAELQACTGKQKKTR